MSTCVRPVVVLLSLLLFTSKAFSESHSAPVAPSGGSGYVGTLTFNSGISNCYGDVSVAFGKEVFAPKAYLYKGKSYTPAELNLSEFKKHSLDYTVIEADLYAGGQNLGHLKMDNVTFFSGTGCFGETYHVTEMLKLNERLSRANRGAFF